MVSNVERYGWAVVLTVLMVLAIPWFLWGDSRVTLGLPLWLWWHVGWLTLSSAVFWLFARRAWGVWITDTGPTGGERA